MLVKRIKRTFSIFQLPIFVEPYRQNYVHLCRALITRLKHAISPYSGNVWVLIANNFAINPEIWTENSENFNEIGDLFWSRTCETDASHVRMLREHVAFNASWIFNEPCEYVFLDGVSVPNIWYHLHCSKTRIRLKYACLRWYRVNWAHNKFGP